eukprot:gene8518-10257_t
MNCNHLHKPTNESSHHTKQDNTVNPEMLECAASQDCLASYSSLKGNLPQCGTDFTSRLREDVDSGLDDSDISMCVNSNISSCLQSPSGVSSPWTWHYKTMFSFDETTSASEAINANQLNANGKEDCEVSTVPAHILHDSTNTTFLTSAKSIRLKFDANESRTKNENRNSGSNKLKHLDLHAHLQSNLEIEEQPSLEPSILTSAEIRHALPSWMCTEVCGIKKRKTRRGCRGHRRNKKNSESENTLPASHQTPSKNLPLPRPNSAPLLAQVHVPYVTSNTVTQHPFPLISPVAPQIWTSGSRKFQLTATAPCHYRRNSSPSSLF